MAKRRGGIDPMAFVTQQQGDGGGLKDLGALMKLLGLGEGQGEEERLSKAQQAQQAYYEGMIGQQAAAGGRAEQELADRRAEAKAAGEERLAAELARQETKRYQEEATLRDIKAKESEEGYKNFAQIMASPDYTKEEKRRIASKRSPEATAVEAEMKKERVGEFKKGLEDVYKKGPKEIAAYVKNAEAIPGMKEVMQDPSIRWTELNAGLPAAQPGLLSKLLAKIPSTAGMWGERERAAAAAAKVAPAPAGEASVSPTTVVPNAPVAARPMAFTGYEPPVEGPIRRGYGAVPEGTVGGPALPELLSKALGLAAPPSTGRGYYTPNAPIAEAPAPVDKVMEMAGVTGRNAAPPFVYEPGGPSAMPGAIEQPGFLENFLKQISDYGASRPERVPAERYPYPIGHGVPPTPPIDPRLLQ